MFVVGRWSSNVNSERHTAMNTITAWTHDDLLTDLKAEVLEVRKEYGVPSLNHIPDFELVPLAYAQLGDLVHVGKGRIGIVYDIAEVRNAMELSIVCDNFRVVMKRISL